jgi:hypothetical protein
MLIFEPSEDNDREFISASCNELSKNESVNLLMATNFSGETVLTTEGA